MLLKKVSVGLLFAALAVLLVAASAVGEADEVVVIGHGQVNGYHWSAEAAPEGEGLCFEVAVFKPKAPEYGNGGGQCSFPARRRGILRVVPNSHKRGAPKVVAVGAVFNRAVAAVRVVDFKGRVKHLRLHLLKQARAADVLRKFKYSAFAVAGPWCVRTLTTYDRHGHRLWETEWTSFDVGWWRIPGSNPSTLCPH